MEFNSFKDIIFDNIVEKIKNRDNEYYECKIINETTNYNLHMKFIQLNIDGEKSESFIANENIENLIGKTIIICSNSLKIKIINNRPYFLIKKYKLINEEKNNVIKRETLLLNLKSSQYKIITSTKNLDQNYLYTLILKAKEIIVKNQQYKLYKFQMEDSDNNIVNIDGLENFDFENGRLYYFNGYKYNKLLNKFEITNISYIEKLSTSTLRMLNAKEIIESKVDSLLHFKGKVKSFKLTDNIIIVEDENNKIHRVNANYHLIKQLSLNNECKFYYFYKKNDNEFYFSNLSFIESKEETFINFNFPAYDFEKKHYNKIKINDIYYDIEKKNIKIRVEDKNKNIIFPQKIFYERVFEDKILDSYSFDIELIKGKIYYLDSLLGKNDFSYEFYIQSLKENNLPEFISVKYNDNKIKIEPDKNDNKLCERFTLINFPKQDIKSIFNLSDEYNQTDDKNNIKYLLMIDANKNKTLKKFEKLNDIKEKETLYLPDIKKNKLKEISEKCFNNYIEENDNKLDGIDKDDINFFSKYMYELLDGFNRYNFENTKEHYIIIKDITSFFINYIADILLGKYYIFRKNYEILIDKMLNLEYIDRIKILITFMIKITKIVGKEKVYYDMFNLIDLDNKKSYENFPFVKNAFDIFYKIIDDMKEDCPFFQALHQFNSIIYKDILSGENLHSTSILNLNDIKLELIKNINRFIFLSEKSGIICDDYGNFEDASLLVTINMYSFCDNDNYIFDEKNYKKATSVVLFLLFHECFGHQKKNINNEGKITPRKHYTNDFQDIICEKIDTGSALEKILIGKIANLSYFMNSDNSEKLLDPKLYIGKDFNELHQIYSSIENDNGEEKKVIKIKSDENNTSHNKKVFTQKKRRLMYSDLLELFCNVDENDKEKLKDNEDYQRFLMLYERRHQKPTDYLKIPDILTRRFNEKNK